MIKSINSGKAGREKILMLNITGGGEKLFKSANKVTYLRPDYIIDNKSDANLIISKAESLF
jgi:cysteate synthase